MPDQNNKRPGERNEYRLEYRPIRPYIPPEKQPDPPPIVRDIDRVPLNYHTPPAQNESSQPQKPHRMERPANQPTRRPRRVRRPFSVNAALTLFFVFFLAVGAAPAGLLYVAFPEAVWLLLMGLGAWAFVGLLLTGFLSALFNELAEFIISLAREGTARALAEAD